MRRLFTRRDLGLRGGPGPEAAGKAVALDGCRLPAPATLHTGPHSAIPKLPMTFQNAPLTSVPEIPSF